MAKEFRQIEWDAAVEEDCRQIVRLAVREDLDRMFDWTTVCLVPSDSTAEAAVVTRQQGVVCGLRAAQLALSEMDGRVTWSTSLVDGARIAAGQTLATIAGPARSLLTAERILLNLIGRLSGIATLTQKYVEAVAPTRARIYDTRKTTPGWRRLEKYAVHCGGGRNHRTGLFDAILIKDNHLALGAAGVGTAHLTPADAVRRAREFAHSMGSGQTPSDVIVEVEVDTLVQLEQVLGAGPDLVLVDNMSLDDLRRAVTIRNALAPEIELEASGGVNLQTVGAIAATGVDRISVGALTHSAAGLDVGLDWK
ncbi:MAG: carboxylating nicotinate-nucleotide diphosphorylase [Planctomycetia bacterium]|nr:carboxylating nicotinate-nucleotide diphosphorylase [Planctomycetia bacterium]